MKRFATLCIVTGMLSMTSMAFGQEEGEPNLVSRYGMAAYAGGGVGGFINSDMRDIAGTAGLWEVRFQFGTRLPVGFELAYLGGLQTVTDSLGIDKNAYLMTNGAEATVRGNLLTDTVITPYAFAGLGWTRFDLANYDVNTSSVEDHDNVMTIPLGIGVAYRFDRFVADLRGTYRPTIDEDLVPEGDGGEEDLDSWAAALHAGFEF